MSNLYESYAFYTSSGSGAMGLSVNCDVYSASGSFLISNNPATEIGGGFYKFTYDAPVEDSYLFKFRCGNAGVDSQQIGALYANKIDVPYSVWNYVDRQLTGFGNLVNLIWTNATRTLTSSGGALTASEVWTWPMRFLTNVSVSDGHTIVINSPITFQTFADNSVVITNVADEAEIFFTVKKYSNEPDHKAIIQLSKTGGLLRLNGKDPAELGISPTSGSLVVINGNAIVSLTTQAAPVIYGTLENAFTGEIKTKTVFGVETIITQMPVYVKQSVTHTI